MVEMAALSFAAAGCVRGGRGIAAAFKAPIAGAVFAAQNRPGQFSMNLFAPLLIASVIASIISRGFLESTSGMKFPGLILPG